MPTPNFWFKLAFYLLLIFLPFFGGLYIGHLRLEAFKEAEVKKDQTYFNEVVEKQAIESKKAQDEKDELSKRYNSLIAQYRGLLYKPNDTKTAPAPIREEGIRLLESDAEFLIGFAKECSNTEIERNDAIQKYNDLIQAK